QSPWADPSSSWLLPSQHVPQDKAMSDPCQPNQYAGRYAIGGVRIVVAAATPPGGTFSITLPFASAIPARDVSFPSPPWFHTSTCAAACGTHPPGATCCCCAREWATMPAASPGWGPRKDAALSPAIWPFVCSARHPCPMADVNSCATLYAGFFWNPPAA